MSEFAKNFMKAETVKMEDWEMTAEGRVNKKIGEEIKYEPKMAFADYFVADKADFLNRVLPLKNDKKTYFPYWILVWLVSLVLAIKTKKYKWFWWGSLFLGLGFGELLRSGWQLGWWVFYGPVVKNLEIAQVVITVGVIEMFYLIREKKWKWMLPLAFWINPIVKIVRVSIIEGEYLAGIMINGFKFVGIGVKNGIRLINQDFESGVASAFLKFDLGNYWLEMGIKILLGFGGVWVIDKLPKNWKRIKLGLIIILVLVELWQGLTGDPKAVL
jgi:hypothetical protein